jgi:hypothetical protein
VSFVVIVENFSFFRQAHWFGGDEEIPILWAQWRAKRRETQQKNVTNAEEIVAYELS